MESKKESSFLQAVEEGNIQKVQQLIDTGINPACRETVPQSPLSIACTKGHFEIVQLLLADKRIDPLENAFDALKHTATKGHLPIMNLLLADKRVKYLESGNTYAELLRLSCEHAHLELVKLFLQDKIIDPSFDNFAVFRWARSQTYTSKFIGVVKLLLEDPRIYNHVDKWASGLVTFLSNSGYGYVDLKFILQLRPIQTIEDKIVAEFQHKHMPKEKLSVFFKTVRDKKYTNVGLFLQGFFCDKGTTLKQLNKDNITEIVKTYDALL
jgi:hypothetical protein